MITKNKRVIYLPDGSKLNLADMELREFIDPLSYAAQELYDRAFSWIVSFTKKYGKAAFRDINYYGIGHFLTYRMWSEVNVDVKYVGDMDKFHRDDWWQLPSETANWKTGDCEDSSFYLASGLSLLQQYGEKVKYYVCVGYYVPYGYTKPEYYGHAYLIYYFNFLKEWAILESTFNSEVPYNYAIKWDANHYVPAICFNRKEVLNVQLKRDRSTLNLSDSWYNLHKDYIDAMVEYVTLGKKMETSWMHKTERPANPPLVEVAVREVTNNV